MQDRMAENITSDKMSAHEVDRWRGLTGSIWDFRNIRSKGDPGHQQTWSLYLNLSTVSTSEGKRAFSSMNDILSAKGNSLAVRSLSNLIFMKCKGSPLEQFNPHGHVRSWLAKRRRWTDERACKAPNPSSKDEPKTRWSNCRSPLSYFVAADYFLKRKD